MAGKVHYEGHTYYGSTSLSGTASSTLYLGLYTNSTELAKGDTMTNITEVSGGGYGRIALSDVDWTEDSTKTANSGTLFTQPRKTFLFSSGVGLVYGYFITTKTRIENPLTAPTLLAQTDPDTATALPADTYYVKYTWVNADGETQASPSASVATTSGQEIAVTLPTFPSGVTSANVYISPTSGSETKQGNTTTTSYIQSDVLVAGANLPANNTTDAGGQLISSEHFSSVVDVNQPDFEIRITAKQEFI